MVYKEKPKKFSPKMEVVSCFIEVNNKVLFLHRHDKKPQGNTWSRPAGKVDRNESIEEAMLREIKEELSLDLKKGQPIFSETTYVKYPEYDFVYHMFTLPLADLPHIHLNPIEHKDFKWLTPEEALTYNLIPGEAECIKLHYQI